MGLVLVKVLHSTDILGFFWLNNLKCLLNKGLHYVSTNCGKNYINLFS